MHVIAHRFQVARTAAIHQQRLIAAAEQVPELLVPPIEAAGVGPQQPFHARDQRGLRGLDDQMNMIGHQAIGMHLPKRLLAGFAQGPQKILVIRLALENRLAAVAAIHHVVDCAGILNSELSRHASDSAGSRAPSSRLYDIIIN